MADTVYRANLSAPNIPTDPLTQGRTVIIKGYDNNYAPNLASKSDEDKDIGIPQVLYAANVLPTDYGYRSMQYSGPRAICDGTPYAAFAVRSSTDSALLIHTKEGYLFRLRKSTEGNNVSVFTLLGTYTGKVTYATVAGTTYIYFSNNGCYKYDFATKALVAVTLTGLTPSAIVGVTGTGGYLLAWSVDTIAWSSLFNPTDFVPSLDTGAGGGSVEGARGAITVCISNPLGVFVFTEDNCVSATLSNNARFPFNFKEIIGSSGVRDVQHVTYEGNAGTAYAYTPDGFQQINNTGAKAVWSDLFDNGNATPIWTEDTVVSDTFVGTPREIQETKLTIINNRYVCVSVYRAALGYYDSVWVFDTSLNRWGRLVKNHYEVFEDESNDIALITTEGRYVVCDTAFETDVDVDASVQPYLVLGKYQNSRQRLTQLQGIALENLLPREVKDPVTGVVTEPARLPSVYVLTSTDGKSGSFSPTYRRGSEYLYSKVGINHTIMIKGDFVLNSVVLTLNNHGGR